MTQAGTILEGAWNRGAKGGTLQRPHNIAPGAYRPIGDSDPKTGIVAEPLGNVLHITPGGRGWTRVLPKAEDYNPMANRLSLEQALKRSKANASSKNHQFPDATRDGRSYSEEEEELLRAIQIYKRINGGRSLIGNTDVLWILKRMGYRRS